MICTVGFSTKLSSAGLVYKHFGEEVVSKILGVQKDDPQVNTSVRCYYISLMVICSKR
jgi:uncharacterized UPF0160 family protein